MIVILVLFPALLVAVDGFGVSVGFGPLLSGRNVLIAIALLLIAFRMLRQGRPPAGLPAILLCFLVWIAYAVLTWAAASFFIQYERYPVWQNLKFLKLLVIDQFLIFLVFFYGPRSEAEATWALKALLLVVGLAQVFTIGEWSGILPTHFVTSADATGRLNGFIAQANQYALFSACFVPALVATGLNARGIERLLWWSLAVLSVMSIVVTLSRGAVVACLISGGLWVYLFRGQIRADVVVRGALVSTFVLVAIGATVASTRYGGIVYERIFADTFQQQSFWQLSAGRTGLWNAAFDRMALEPITFLTGYGWRAYWALPHLLAPHNTYLDLWFNLGLPGLFAVVGIFTVGLACGVRAAGRASGTTHRQLLASTAGVACVAIGLFFTEWYEPWSYFWAYFGLMMRMTLLAGSSALGERIPADTVSARERSSGLNAEVDTFGWSRPKLARTDT